MKLMREIRFSVLPDAGEVTNSWAGWPAAAAVAPFLRLQAIVRGEADPRSGFLCQIGKIDRLLREHVVPLIVKAYRQPSSPGARQGAAGFSLRERANYEQRTPDLAPPSNESLLQRSWSEARAAACDIELDELRLFSTPYLIYSTSTGLDPMVSVTESFEFSASHRLYIPTLSEEENRALFGKCANPNGHGHNYVVEVTVRGEPDATTGRIIHIHDLELIVRESVVDRFDHKHLNLDCPEFAELNPSVENITQVIWNLLDGRFSPAELAKVRVWETPKTYAEIEKGTRNPE